MRTRPTPNRRRYRTPTSPLTTAKPARDADPRAPWVVCVNGQVTPVPEGGRVIIGSDATCDVRIADHHVSGRHCAVSCWDGRLSVQDLHSTNGTWLDGRRVRRAGAREPVTLRCGGRTLLLARAVGKRAPGALRWCGMVGRDERTLAMWERLAAVAPSDASVWLFGESGVGKEHAARALHEASPRRDGPWVALNCAALPDEIAESELFGVVRGAFTGADRTRTGAFGRADGGTLLLDEVGELSPAIQAKLLRVLETGELRAVGGEEATTVDVRVVAASWRDLEEAAHMGDFRHDLLHRLWVLRVDLPPLRQRPSDVAALLELLLAQEGASDLWPEPALLGTLERGQWPGNVRQLKNHALRAAISGDPRDLLPAELGTLRGADLLRLSAEAQPGIISRLLRSALREHRGNRTAAARALGVSRSTFYRWLRRTTPEAASPAIIL